MPLAGKEGTDSETDQQHTVFFERRPVSRVRSDKVMKKFSVLFLLVVVLLSLTAPVLAQDDPDCVEVSVDPWTGEETVGECQGENGPWIGQIIGDGDNTIEVSINEPAGVSNPVGPWNDDVDEMTTGPVPNEPSAGDPVPAALVGVSFYRITALWRWFVW
jgi:hypothetical protein